MEHFISSISVMILMPEIKLLGDSIDQYVDNSLSRRNRDGRRLEDKPKKCRLDPLLHG